MMRAQEIDPLSPQANLALGWALIRARRYDEAIRHARRTLELEPKFPPAWRCLALAYTLKGKATDAVGEARKLMEASGATREDLAAVTAAAEASGMDAFARWTLRKLQEAVGQGRVSPYEFASQYALVGDKKQALEWLTKARAERDPMLVPRSLA